MYATKKGNGQDKNEGEFQSQRSICRSDVEDEGKLPMAQPIMK